MPTPTPELGLQKAVDGDDTADYLTIALANSLGTVDALFNNVSGHTHSGAHQGGPISSSALKGSVDIADWFRSTGHTSPLATTGSGMEMFYDAAQGGTIQAVNRNTSSALPMYVGGSTITLSYTGGSMQFHSDGTATLSGNLTLSAAYLTLGSLYFATNADTYIQRVSAGALATNSSFQCTQLTVATGPSSITGLLTVASLTVSVGPTSLTGALTVGTTITASGAIQGTNVTATQNQYSKGGSYFMGPTDQTYIQMWNPGEMRLSSSPGNFYAAGIVTASGGPCHGNGAYVNDASSETIKTNVAELDARACLNQVMDARMRPISYEYIDPLPQAYLPQASPGDPLEPVAWTAERLGFIAEEVARVIPQAAGIVEGSTLAHGLSIEALIPVLWGAVRALNHRVQTLEGGSA